MAKDRPAVQIIIAIIGVSGALGAAWITHRNSALPPESSPPSVHSEAGVSDDPTKAMLRHFAIKFSSDRQGSDYKDFDLPEDKYELCAKACDDDPQCRTFVYTPRGHEGPNARCWLKATTPPERSVPGFVSGVKIP